MEMRAQLLMAFERCRKGRYDASRSAKVPGMPQARVSDRKPGKIHRFSIDLLVRLAARADSSPGCS